MLKRNSLKQPERKEKLKTNRSNEHGHKNPEQNISKSYPIMY